jgi:hypothetical protein
MTRFIVFLPKYYLNDKDKMVTACSRGWEDNIKMDLEEIGCEVVDWIHLAQDRDQWRALVNTVMKFRVP